MALLNYERVFIAVKRVREATDAFLPDKFKKFTTTPILFIHSFHPSQAFFAESATLTSHYNLKDIANNKS